MINRLLTKKIETKLSDGKAIIIMGARQVGKTTLMKMMVDARDDVLWLNGDEPDIRAVFENISSTRLKAIIGEKRVIVIDEAQRIENIGMKLKLITDQMPDIKVISSGSSSFDLANKINEPLTGRKWEFTLYPFSFEELSARSGFLEEKRMLPNRLVYGAYPEVVLNPGGEKEILKELSDSYLYKDILMFEAIKKPEKIQKLLMALAYQVGSQVSYPDVGQACGLDYKTVEKYIELLEKAYIIFRLGSFSRNLRNELKKSRKVYFYDNGIRNASIADFRPLEMRGDVGPLWENYLVSERVKMIGNHGKWANSWFWRTQQQQEIDYIEEENGTLKAFEFKWNPNARSRSKDAFLETYPNSSLEVIHPENFEGFIMQLE
jgi:predicted AAA+ superfamily ATPase